MLPANHMFFSSEAASLAPKTCLTGGFKPSEKYEFVSWDDEIPNNEKSSSHVPVTTNQMSLAS